MAAARGAPPVSAPPRNEVRGGASCVGARGARRGNGGLARTAAPDVRGRPPRAYEDQVMKAVPGFVRAASGARR